LGPESVDEQTGELIRWMECLYCHKRLGLFAFMKGPFCSESHEVAYQDQQSTLAIRRVLDPLLSLPPKAPPLSLMPQPESPTGVVSATVAIASASAPAQGAYLRQRRPRAIAPDLAALGVALKAEPSAPGPVELPSSSGCAIAPDVNSSAVDSAAPEPAPRKPTRASNRGKAALNASSRK
jgi:hypothetical protein